MQNLLSTTATQTMSSIELVKIINDMREDGKPVLAHTDFMTRIGRVSKETGISFKTDTYQHQQNKQFYPCALLCSRLSKLMVMSESVKVQLAVLDRVTELESAQPKPPTNYLEALTALVQCETEKQAALAENSKLTTIIDNEFGYSSILRAAKFLGVSETTFNWRLLKSSAIGLKLPPKKVPSPRYGYQCLYPIKAFELAYPQFDFEDLTPEFVDDLLSLAIC
jgi:hypothetical protein